MIPKDYTYMDTYDKLLASLIKNDQPFMVAKYAVWAVLPSDKRAMYEIILWNSIEVPHYHLVISKREFLRLKSLFSLKVLHREDDGVLYGVNHRYKELYTLLQEELKPIELERKRLYRTGVRGAKDSPYRELNRQEFEIRKKFKKTHKIKEIALKHFRGKEDETI